MEKLKDIIKKENPHEITIYETGISKPIIFEKDVIDFCSDHIELLERKVKYWDMTIEKFMYVRLDKKELNFIKEVLTVNEAAELWGISEGTIRYHLKQDKLTLGVDYRKAGRITLITKEAMIRLFGAIKEDR